MTYPINNKDLNGTLAKLTSSEIEVWLTVRNTNRISPYGSNATYTLYHAVCVHGSLIRRTAHL